MREAIEQRFMVSCLVKAFRNEEGLTLLDVLFATFLISLGLFQLALILYFGLIRIDQSNLRTEATTLAQSTLEELIAADYVDVVDREDEYGTIEHFPDFRRIIIVDDDIPMANVKTIRVAILWRISGGGESTEDGESFDSTVPNDHRPFIEFVTLKYRL